MAVGRSVVGPRSAFLLPSKSVQTHRTFVLLPSAAANSISQLAPRGSEAVLAKRAADPLRLVSIAPKKLN